jgi:LPS export ABC transporter protein LptC
MFFKKHDKPHITVALIGVTVMLFMICPSCKKEKTDTIANFADRKAVPAMYFDSVTMLISDSGRIRYKVIAQTWKVFDQADEPYWYFPEGVYFERFNDSLEVESIVRGDTARYFTEQELWELKNDVLVKNLSGEQFETNLLYWSQQKHKVYSDSFIRIQQADQILTGYGFESNESLSKYKIFKIKGVFPLDVEEDGLNNPE